jgi:hypothetical protein
MAENFEFNRQLQSEMESGNLFQEVMLNVGKPEAKSEALKAVDSLDGSDKRTFEAVVDSMKSIMDRINALPESVRAQFLTENEAMDGPVYEILRTNLKGN